MKKSSRLIGVLVLVCFVAGCGMGEFFIKRALKNLEGDVAKEFKSFADFSEAQEQEIDSIAAEFSAYLKTQQLPKMAEHMERTASIIEQRDQLTQEEWNRLTTFLESPFKISSNADLVNRIAGFVHALPEEKRMEIIENMDEQFEESLEKKQKDTQEKRNDGILKSLKTALKDLGFSLSRKKLKDARKMLDQRQSYLEMDMQQSKKSQEAFKAWLTNADVPLEQYQVTLQNIWQEGEKGPREMDFETWQKNQKVNVDVFNFLIAGSSSEERSEAADKIRNYAGLLIAPKVD